MTIFSKVNGASPMCFSKRLHLELSLQYTLLSFFRTFLTL